MEHIQKNYKKIIILMLGLLATAIGVFAIYKRFTKQKTDSIAISNKNFSFEVKKNDSLSKTSKTLGLEDLVKLSPETYQEKTEIVYDVTLNKKI